MVFAPENFFDLNNVLVNEIVGDAMLFIIICVAIIIYFAIKTDVPTPAIFLLIFVFICIMAFQYAIIALWAFGVLVCGVIFYYGLRKNIT